MQTYVLVGIGGRARMFTEAITGKYKDSTKLTAVCDNNKGRLNLAREKFKSIGQELVIYPAEDFEKMLACHNPDCVIICTWDFSHDEYICRSLESGFDVIVEKPMTTDEKRCQRIIDAVKKTGKSVRVTFNCRYSPARSQVKELLMDGVIGKILSVEFQWWLDTNHGVDYYRRWHRKKANSGGLMVHKASHHFDLINWWLSSVPKTVFARGGKIFYNASQAKRYGLENHAKRCLDCQLKHKCNFYLDINAFEIMKDLYLKNEKYDGYIRDCCIFDEDIDIEDSMNVIVEYRNRVFLSYSLNAFTPWEGYKVAFNGTKGRLEHLSQESSYVSGDGRVQGSVRPEGTSIKVFPHFKTPYSIEVKKGFGSHAGGDVVMLNDIFNPLKSDPLRRCADYVQGSYSVLIGIAANKSMANGQMIYIDELVTGLPEPEFPKMPVGQERISYVSDSERYSDGVKANANNLPW
ncbi:MAG: Gfo/Idh/MocA family oxidoreductase [Planctomycetota bacterium]